MDSLTAPLISHHKHCDDLFADAEAAVVDKNWQVADVKFVDLASELETHFGTEEELLFPAFEAASGMTGGPTQVMRYEHAQMRDLLNQMRGALERRDAPGFAGAAETLLILMQQHNMKEENILYPMCNNSLAGKVDQLAGELSEKLGAACPVAR